ncbi:hypothetical protein Rsub_13407 [Raphidocelis subcapitata]|uniref:Uncharacterized protein n=1 Tax=Raphidocelis subcapitata TaxID=307507 RepID=A0A2V0PLJ6_9CHLO|nr:hypothetical protein Rsub_13407 [Raphidocelis subcapitata]|eukprot:GBG00597.1 hypothetical protein Rsub_13407 [Raphidocelis subcapitata]
MRAACLVLCVWLALLAACAPAEGRRLLVNCGPETCGCGARNPWTKTCYGCKPCDVKELQKRAKEAADSAKRAAAKVGDVLDEARAAVSDPSGYIRKTIINGAQDFIGDQLESALAVKNVCTTNDEKDAFRAGGWTAYYGKRLWDGRLAAMAVGSIVPATSGLAINEFYSELKAQTNSVMDQLEQAASDAGDNIKEMFTSLITALIEDPTSDQAFDEPTFGMKATILHIACNNEAAGIKLPSEGYSQFAFAYKIKG